MFPVSFYTWNQCKKSNGAGSDFAGFIWYDKDICIDKKRNRRLMNTQEKFKEIEGVRKLEQEQEGDGQRITYILGIRQILYDTENEKEAYTIQVCRGERIYTRRYTLTQITRRKFLQDFGIDLQNEDEFYRKLRKEILQMEFPDEYVSYETARNGLQKVKGRWMYVFGNGSIDTVGFRSDVKSRIGGIYFPSDKIFERHKYIGDIRELFRVYDANPTIFYPMFFINIMGITNGYFRNIGEDSFMRLSLWLDGASGSGKTEIAKVGTYAFGDKEFGGREVVSVTGKRKDVLIMLLQSSGGVCIVDDVKREAVRERRNGVKNNVDDCIRSIFQDCLTDSVSGYSDCRKIDCCAVITGEYLDTYESQNARMIYIRADGFLKDKKNSEALRRLQEQPKLLAGVCGGYIQFLLRKMEESSFSGLVKAKLKEMRSGEKMYQGINNAERLHENSCMLKMAAWLTEEYFYDAGLPEPFINEFHQNTEKSINDAMDATYYLLGGGQMVMLKVMERVFQKAKIRKASYQEFFGRRDKWKYHQEYFWLDKQCDDFLWIDDYKKSMKQDNQETQNSCDENPVLIIRKERLEELFHHEIQIFLKEKSEISSKIAGSIINQFWKMLRELRIIYQTPRNDSKQGRPAAEYPVFIRYTDSGEYGESLFYVMEFESVIQINTEHPCIEKQVEYIFGIDAEQTFENGGKLEIIDKEGRPINADGIYEKRRKFMRGKSLYRK